MELKPSAGSDRAWVWNTLADFADESPKPELLAIRFLNAESECSCTCTNGPRSHQGDTGRTRSSFQLISAHFSLYVPSVTAMPSCLCSYRSVGPQSSVMRGTPTDALLCFSDAQKFKAKFDECKEMVRKAQEEKGIQNPTHTKNYNIAPPSGRLT